jgi:hypothetical protein
MPPTTARNGNFMKYFVSYRTHAWSNNCGNQSFENPNDAIAFIGQTYKRWQSFSLMTFVPHHSGISDLKPLTEETGTTFEQLPDGQRFIFTDLRAGSNELNTKHGPFVKMGEKYGDNSGGVILPDANYFVVAL